MAMKIQQMTKWSSDEEATNWKPRRVNSYEGADRGPKFGVLMMLQQQDHHSYLSPWRSIWYTKQVNFNSNFQKKSQNGNYDL